MSLNAAFVITITLSVALMVFVVLQIYSTL